MQSIRWRRRAGGLGGMIVVRFEVVKKLLDHEIDQRFPVARFAVMAALQIGPGFQLVDRLQAGEIFLVSKLRTSASRGQSGRRDH